MSLNRAACSCCVHSVVELHTRNLRPKDLRAAPFNHENPDLMAPKHSCLGELGCTVPALHIHAVEIAAIVHLDTAARILCRGMTARNT